MMDSIYEHFFQHGEVVEIRALDMFGKGSWNGYSKGTVSGYFDNAESFHEAACALDKAGARGVYFTINPVVPALLARAANRLVANPKNSTQDRDIATIRWLPIDLDPKRPAGISATDEEVSLAIATGKEIVIWLEKELGFAQGIRAFSGNGLHLLYRLPDLLNTPESEAIVKCALMAIADRFTTERIEVDRKVTNPARIWKCFGTTGRKGDSTKDRPHRRSYLYEGQPTILSDIPINDFNKIKSLADLAPKAENVHIPTKQLPDRVPESMSASRFENSQLGPLHVDRYLNNYGVHYRIKQDGALTLYILEHCLFNPDHGRDASIVSSPRGLYYQCFHNSCQDKRWKDAKRIISGNDSLARFCAGYDPDRPFPRHSLDAGKYRNLYTGAVTRSPVMDFTGNVIPSPQDVDVMEFYTLTRKRPEFVPRYLANYIAMYLAPIACTAGVFWQYRDGVWRQYPLEDIQSIIVMAMKDKIQGKMIDNITKILQGLIYRPEKTWDSDPYLINVKNGMLDVRTMEMHQHKPEYFSRIQLPVSYRPEIGESEIFHKYLEEVFPEDYEKDDKGEYKNYMAKHILINQFLGYCLLRDTRYQKALFLYGTGSNGKSTLIDTITAVLGSENTAALSLTTLGDRFKSQYLHNKLVNMASETNAKGALESEIFNKVVTGDEIDAERKYGDSFKFKPFCKFIVSMNETPVVQDKTYAFERRILVINFTRRFTKEEIVPRMQDKLIEDKDAIFTWIVNGLKRLLKYDRFIIADNIQEDIDQLMQRVNPFRIFAEECCFVGTTQEHICSTTEIWEAYRDWCNEGGNRALGRNKFYDQVLMQYPHVLKTREAEDRHRVFRGISLNIEAAQEMRERLRRKHGKD